MAARCIKQEPSSRANDIVRLDARKPGVTYARILAPAGEVHVLARKHGECDRSDGDSYDLRVVSSAR